MSTAPKPLGTFPAPSETRVKVIRTRTILLAISNVAASAYRTSAWSLTEKHRRAYAHPRTPSLRNRHHPCSRQHYRAIAGNVQAAGRGERCSSLNAVTISICSRVVRPCLARPYLRVQSGNPLPPFSSRFCYAHASVDSTMEPTHDRSMYTSFGQAVRGINRGIMLQLRGFPTRSGRYALYDDSSYQNDW
jgi:hypothetical protein